MIGSGNDNDKADNNNILSRIILGGGANNADLEIVTVPEESTPSKEDNKRNSFKLPALDITTTARGSIKNGGDVQTTKSNKNNKTLKDLVKKGSDYYRGINYEPS